MPARDDMPNVINNTGPARNAAVVTPSDSNDLTFVTRGIYVGVAGNIAVIMSGNGGPVTIPVQPGLQPLAVSRIYSTGTTATGLVAVW
jgi:hypothetical protein